MVDFFKIFIVFFTSANSVQRMIRRLILWFLQLPDKLKWVSVTLFLLGSLLIIASFFFHDKLLPFGHLLLVLGSIVALHAVESLIHHYLLHKSFVDEAVVLLNSKHEDVIKALQSRIEVMIDEKVNGLLTKADFTLLVNEVADKIGKTAKDEFRSEVYQIANETNFVIRNLRQVGVSNAFWGLDARKIFDDLARSSHKDFIITRVFFSEAEWTFVVKFLTKHITDKHCRFRIILPKHDHHEVITLRFQRIGNQNRNKFNAYTRSIKEQLCELYKMKKSLPPELQENLEIRAHEDILTCALIGLGDKIVYSSYFHTHLSNEGAQFQTLEGTHLFDDLTEHFNISWKNAYNYQLVRGNLVYERPKIIDNKQKKF